MGAFKAQIGQFPAPTGAYKVCLKNSVSWQGEPEARLQISVGKPGVDSEKFFALCEWAAARFPRTILIVSDTLQRHNLMFAHGMSEGAAYAQSRRDGDAWLDRNQRAILQIPDVEIMRWDTLLNDERTNAALSSLRRHLRESQPFQTALQTTISAFWNRNRGKSATFEPEREKQFTRHSEEFLLEELAVFTWLCARNGVDVYPGSWMENIFAALGQANNPLFAAFQKDWIQVDYTRTRRFALANSEVRHSAPMSGVL